MRIYAYSFLVGWAVFCFLTVSVTPARTFAQADSAAQRTEFDRVLAQALSEFDLGNWTEARALFERAHELRPSARTLRAIAMCAFEEKSYVAASLHAQRAIDDTRKPLEEEQRKQMEQVIERARGFIARIELVLQPTDAEVRVDLKAPTLVEGTLLLDPGEHELLVRAEGYEAAQHRIVVRPRDQRRLEIELQKTVVADVVTPSGASDAPPGLSLRKRLAIGVGAVGVAALGTGLVFGLLAKKKQDDAGCDAGRCPNPSAVRTNDQALKFANVSTGTVIGGLVVAGAGVALFLWPESQSGTRRDTTARLSPSLSTSHAGFALEGTW